VIEKGADLKYVKIQTSLLYERSFAEASPSVRGTWLTLMLVAGRNYHGGRIVGAAKFSKHDWHWHGQSTRKLADAVCKAGLATWDNDDLLLLGYDISA
jgi:hypothetical protein